MRERKKIYAVSSGLASLFRIIGTFAVPLKRHHFSNYGTCQKDSLPIHNKVFFLSLALCLVLSFLTVQISSFSWHRTFYVSNQILVPLCVWCMMLLKKCLAQEGKKATTHIHWRRQHKHIETEKQHWFGHSCVCLCCGHSLEISLTRTSFSIRYDSRPLFAWLDLRNEMEKSIFMLYINELKRNWLGFIHYINSIINQTCTQCIRSLYTLYKKLIHTHTQTPVSIGEMDVSTQND